MRRIGRVIFVTLTGLSLALAVATAALWVRSYWRFDYTVSRTDSGVEFWPESFRGRLRFTLESGAVGAPADVYAFHSLPPDSVDAKFFWFALADDDGRRRWWGAGHVGAGYTWGGYLMLPHAAAVAAFLALPAAVAWRSWRRRRRGVGRGFAVEI